MTDVFRFLDRWLNRLMIVVILVTTAMIVGLITFLILSRFVFGWSVVGLLELSTLSAIWLYMVGAVIATRSREHIVVDFLAQSLRTARMQAAHRFLVSLIVLVLGVFFLSLSKDMIDWAIRRPQLTPGLGIPLFVGQAAIVVAAVLGFIYTLRDVIQAAVELMHSKAEG
tara:strand:+ start:1896 stop:2402 length:507 start_codon:yes stop_codon:yes gene_type:complete